MGRSYWVLLKSNSESDSEEEDGVEVGSECWGWAEKERRRRRRRGGGFGGEEPQGEKGFHFGDARRVSTKRVLGFKAEGVNHIITKS